MNIFEGARRILKIVMLIVVVGGLAATWFDKPYVTTKYRIAKPGAAPIRATDCDESSALEILSRKLPSGKEVSVTLCFDSHSSAAGKKLIPFVEIQDGTLLMNEKYSSEVSGYTHDVAAKFEIRKDDETSLDQEWLHERYKNLVQGVGWTILSVLMLWCLSWTLGWIVRGFLGIRSGMDFKQK